MRPAAGILRWLLIGLVSLLITAPASLAGRLLIDTPFCLIASHGSLWRGGAWLSARSLNGAATPITPLSWSLSWKNGPAFALTTYDGTGALQPKMDGFEMAMPAFLVNITSLPLPAFLAGHAPSGRLHGLTGHFECNFRLECRGTAMLRIENLALGAFPRDKLGNVDIALLANEFGFSAHLKPDGTAALNGEATLSRENGRTAISWELHATSLASTDLGRSLISLR